MLWFMNVVMDAIFTTMVAMQSIRACNCIITMSLQLSRVDTKDNIVDNLNSALIGKTKLAAKYNTTNIH